MKFNFKNLFSVFCFLFFLALLSSCRVKKVITESPIPISKKDSSINLIDPNTYFKSLEKNEIKYQWFGARLSVEYNDGKIEQSFNATLRMRKDSVIWISLYGPFGIEGGRVLITKDSVQIINRLTSEYSKRPLTSLKKFLPINADLPLLQDFIMGYYLKFKNTQNSARDIQDSLLALRMEDYSFQYDINTFLQNYTITHSLLVDKMVKQQLDATFDGYLNISEKPFSTVRNIVVKRASDTVKLNLEFSKFKINEPLDFPFDIGTNLKQIE